ncbi:MAG: hypothetical protein H7A33_03225 [Deltaproteobacteria bacterium]|nr:hypothetical protein [Deltaproteobacteria bacterium]
MYRTDRYFGKNDNKKNFFGEDDYIDIKSGNVKTTDLEFEDLSPENSHHKNEDSDSPS